MAAMKLEVSIIQATGLHHLNMSGDKMYCHCEVQHLEKHAHKVKCETQPQKGLEPVWNELFELEPWHVGEALEFTIYDKGLLNSKEEGKAVLPSEYFYPNGFEGQLPISGLEHAVLYVVVRPIGDGMMGEEPVDAEQMAQMAGQDPNQGPYMEGPPQKLQVTIMQASGLEHMNHFTGDSPYVVCEVEHVNKHDKHKPSKFQTKAVKGLNPVWQETKELDPWHIGEPVKFTVLDKGLMGSKSEGVVSVPSEIFYPNGFEGPLTIPNKEHSQLFVSILPMGPSTTDLQLEVTIIQADNLKHLMHFTGDSPFVSCSVKHTKSRSKAAKIQTKTIKHGANPLDPIFDETHMLGPWTWDEPLEFGVFDKGLLGAKSEGKAILAAEHFYPNGFEGMIPLEGCPEASLAVRIVPAGPWSATSTATTVRPGQFVSSGTVTYPTSYTSIPQPVPYSPGGMMTAQPLPMQYMTYAAPASMTYVAQPMAPQPVTYAAPSSMSFASPVPAPAAQPVTYAAPSSMSFASPVPAPAAQPVTYAAPSSMTFASPVRAPVAQPVTYAAPSSMSISAPSASYIAQSSIYKASAPSPTSYAIPASSFRAPLPAAAAAPVMYSSPAMTYAQAPAMGYVASQGYSSQGARGDIFSQVDTNHDGRITRAEFQAAMR